MGGMRGLGALVLWLSVTLFAVAAEAQQRTPFGAPAPGPSTAAPFANPNAAPPSAEAPQPSAWARMLVWVNTTQHALHRQLAQAVRGLKSGDSLAAGWLLVSLSFIYGVVHAIGPGHGKAVISSYVLANEQTVRRGILLSFMASAVQALSAIVLVGVLAILLNAAGMRIKQTVGQLETASYALVALVGAWLVISQIRLLRRRRAASSGDHAGHDHAHAHDHHDHAHHDHAHDHDCCGHAHMPDPAQLADGWSLRKAAAIVFAVGVRPCTGAIVVLVFALAHGLFLAGVGATFAMSLGTAITVSVLAAMAVGSRQLAVRFAQGNATWTGRVYTVAALGGSTLVLLLGVLLFWASLGPARPF